MAEVGNEGNPQSNPKYPPLELSSPGPNEDQNSDERPKAFAEVEEGPRNTPPPVYDQGDTPVKTEEVAVEAGDFWHVGNYKRIVKKVEDGAKFCEEFSQMLAERAEIESLYAKKLKAWNKKWLASFSKGLEYGSVLETVRQGLNESEEIAELHLAIQGKVAEVSNQVQEWRNENYHKNIMGLKEAKKSEEGFSKAQKPWAKKYYDTQKGKQTFHSSCQFLDVVKRQDEELLADREQTTQDQINKMKTKLKKATNDREAALENYKEALRDIGNYNRKYMEDMEYEYEKWQSMEVKRKDFITEKFKEFRDCIDLTRIQPRLMEIYSKMLEVCCIANTSKDLEWYRRTFGPDSPFIDIVFVEYDKASSNQIKGKDTNQNFDSSASRKPKEKSKVCVAL